LPDERVVAFEIDLTSGMVVSLSNLPKGWYVVVDNDASWRTKVRGNTLVGAAALDPQGFRNIQLTVEKNESLLPFAVSGEVSVTTNSGKERLIRLGKADMSIAPK